MLTITVCVCVCVCVCDITGEPEDRDTAEAVQNHQEGDQHQPGDGVRRFGECWIFVISGFYTPSALANYTQVLTDKSYSCTICWISCAAFVHFMSFFLVASCHLFFTLHAYRAHTRRQTHTYAHIHMRLCMHTQTH